MNAFPLSASLSDREARLVAPGILAYIGDAVYELYVRQAFLSPPRRLNDHHRCVVGHVRAERQAQHLDAIESALSETELDIVRRGRNATGRVPRRTNRTTYQRATSLEALVGYLYLCDANRLNEVMGWLDLTVVDRKVDRNSKS
ncbi:MAG: Mini-ribonuclease 3 [Oscillatoriales cyanobacterium]|nr:MAG: Mini-ribonuclease 3 [Oscillatoriales cyanobacterium]